MSEALAYLLARRALMPKLQHEIGTVKHSRLAVDMLPGAGDDHWELRLLVDFLIVCPAGQFLIPAGFASDGASIRFRAVSAVIARYGRRALLAALLHDYFYSDGRHLIPADVDDPRLWCDALFLQVLREAGVDRRLARLAYRAVRMFGDTYWGKR